jgi:uncharacterized membrane protein
MKSPMNLHRPTVCIALCICLLLIFPLHQANGQNYVQYQIHLKPDGSADWVITQVSDINASTDTWEGFQQRIFNLAESASNLTRRTMSIDENSLQINNTISTESKTVNYIFTWLNFSVSQNSELRFGDVFAVSGFFTQLYGDSSIQVTYPPAYSVKSVAPAPSEQNSQTQTLQWFRTQDFVYTTPKVILTSSGEKAGSNVNLPQEYTVAIGGTAAVAIALLAGFYLLQKRKRSAQTTASLTALLPVESDEEKIINLIRVSRGNMHQSDITEQLHFSKAKTSQLLAALERKGVITRYKKGRDKIVNLSKTGEK